MKKTITFVKLMNRWFADLPELKDQIDIADCEMVAGADTMIEAISNGKRVITLVLSAEPLVNM